MFKNIIIIILAVAVIAFSYIAIRNSKPIECDEIARATKTELICIIELGDIEEDEVHEALKDRYNGQPLY